MERFHYVFIFCVFRFWVEDLLALVLDVVEDEKDDRAFGLVSVGRTWHLRAGDSEEKTTWVSHFRDCIEIAYQCILRITRSSFGTSFYCGCS